MTFATAEISEPSTFDAAALSRPGQLLLARLLLVKAGAATEKAVRKDLDAVLPRPISIEHLSTLTAELAGAGLLEYQAPKKTKVQKGTIAPPVAPNPAPIFRLSESGKLAAMNLLGFSEVPPKLTWLQLIERHFFPRVAGFTPKAKQNAAVPLLQRKYGLHISDSARLAKALDTLVCKELGFEHINDLKELRAMVLSRHLGLNTMVKPSDIDKQFAPIEFKFRHAKDKLSLAVIRQWADQAAPAAEAQKPFDLIEFALTVSHLAENSPTGRFGNDKVFISHIWRAWESGRHSPTLDLPHFKLRLIEANREGLLKLSRADLVSAMDPTDVRESETRYLNAEFHFILLERGAS